MRIAVFSNNLFKGFNFSKVSKFYPDLFNTCFLYIFVWISRTPVFVRFRKYFISFKILL